MEKNIIFSALKIFVLNQRYVYHTEFIELNFIQYKQN